VSTLFLIYILVPLVFLKCSFATEHLLLAMSGFFLQTPILLPRRNERFSGGTGKTTYFMIRHTPTPSRQWHDLKMEVIGNQVEGYLDGKPEVDYGLPGPVSGKRIVLCILMTVAS